MFLLELETARFDALLRDDAAPLVNIGTGDDLTIRELAEMVARWWVWGELVFDATKPDGIPGKLLDVGWMHRLGWRHSIELEDGLRRTYSAVRERFEGGDILEG